MTTDSFARVATDFGAKTLDFARATSVWEPFSQPRQGPHEPVFVPLMGAGASHWPSGRSQCGRPSRNNGSAHAMRARRHAAGQSARTAYTAQAATIDSTETVSKRFQSEPVVAALTSATLSPGR